MRRENVFISPGAVPVSLGRRDHVGFKTIGSRHLPHARIKLAVDFAGQQFTGFEEHM